MTFLNKLEELFKFYLEKRKIDTFDAFVDELVKLQFLESLDPAVRSFLENLYATNCQDGRWSGYFGFWNKSGLFQ